MTMQGVRDRISKGRRAVGVLLCAVAATGCTSGGPPRSEMSSTPTAQAPLPSATASSSYLPVAAFVPLGRAGCHPASPVRQSPVGPEILATATGGQVWALLFSDIPFPLHRPVKLVWRITDSTTLRLSGTGPGGAPVRL